MIIIVYYITIVSVIFDYCTMPIMIVLQPSLWISYDISFQPTSPKEVPTSTATPLSPPRLHPHHPPRRHRSVRWRRRRSSSCSADGKQPSRKTCSRQSALSQRWFELGIFFELEVFHVSLEFPYQYMLRSLQWTVEDFTDSALIIILLSHDDDDDDDD